MSRAAGRVEAPTHQPGRSKLNTAAMAILLAYLAVVAGLMLLRHITPTPDIFLVFASVVAVILGRGRAFLRDWLPFVAIFLGWEAMRGLADNFGAVVRSDAVIAVERALFFGHVPTEWLQAQLHVVGSASALDVALSLVYLAHFLLPLLVAFVMWTRRGPAYYEFVLAILLLSFAAFFTSLFLPVAPPRFAYQYGEALAVKDVMYDTLVQLHLAPVTTWAYGSLNGNPVAAFPSLHAAYPFLAFLFIRRDWPRMAWVMLGYCLVVWFAIVYLGHHYVVDALGGIAFATGVYALVRIVPSEAIGYAKLAPARVIAKRFPYGPVRNS